MSGTARAGGQRWLDAKGTPITVGVRVEHTGIDAELGALACRLGRQGVVLRRSATRLVVRFDGEATLARVQPAPLRVVTREHR